MASRRDSRPQEPTKGSDHTRSVAPSWEGLEYAGVSAKVRSETRSIVVVFPGLVRGEDLASGTLPKMK